jgi:hypothetical protein
MSSSILIFLFMLTLQTTNGSMSKFEQKIFLKRLMNKGCLPTKPVASKLATWGRNTAVTFFNTFRANSQFISKEAETQPADTIMPKMIWQGAFLPPTLTFDRSVLFAWEASINDFVRSQSFSFETIANIEHDRTIIVASGGGERALIASLLTLSELELKGLKKYAYITTSGSGYCNDLLDYGYSATDILEAIVSVAGSRTITSTIVDIGRHAMWLSKHLIDITFDTKIQTINHEWIRDNNERLKEWLLMNGKVPNKDIRTFTGFFKETDGEIKQCLFDPKYDRVFEFGSSKVEFKPSSSYEVYEQPINTNSAVSISSNAVGFMRINVDGQVALVGDSGNTGINRAVVTEMISKPIYFIDASGNIQKDPLKNFNDGECIVCKEGEMTEFAVRSKGNEVKQIVIYAVGDLSDAMTRVMDINTGVLVASGKSGIQQSVEKITKIVKADLSGINAGTTRLLLTT